MESDEFLKACRDGEVDRVKEALRNKDPNLNVNERDSAYGYTPLIWACKNHRVEVVEQLLQDPDIDVNLQDKYGQTPLSWCCSNGDIEIVRLLLDTPNIDVNKPRYFDNWTPLFRAICNEKIEIVKMILEAGGSVEVKGSEDSPSISALNFAKERKNSSIEIIHLLERYQSK